MNFFREEASWPNHDTNPPTPPLLFDVFNVFNVNRCSGYGAGFPSGRCRCDECCLGGRCRCDECCPGGRCRCDECCPGGRCRCDECCPGGRCRCDECCPGVFNSHYGGGVVADHNTNPPAPPPF